MKYLNSLPLHCHYPRSPDYCQDPDEHARLPQRHSSSGECTFLSNVSGEDIRLYSTLFRTSVVHWKCSAKRNARFGGWFATPHPTGQFLSGHCSPSAWPVLRALCYSSSRRRRLKYPRMLYAQAKSHERDVPQICSSKRLQRIAAFAGASSSPIGPCNTTKEKNSRRDACRHQRCLLATVTAANIAAFIASTFAPSSSN